jgi:DeoR/GlpR family transcriptional regulator of sugar metabolism
MVRRASQTIVLADHTKFDRPSLSVYAPWAPPVTLVSNRRPEGELATALANAHATFIPAM